MGAVWTVLQTGQTLKIDTPSMEELPESPTAYVYENPFDTLPREHQQFVTSKLARMGLPFQPQDVVRAGTATYWVQYTPGAIPKGWVEGTLLLTKKILFFLSEHEGKVDGFPVDFGLESIVGYHPRAKVLRIARRSGLWHGWKVDDPRLGFDVDDVGNRNLSEAMYPDFSMIAGPKNRARILSVVNHQGAPPQQSVMAAETCKLIRYPVAGAAKYGAVVATNQRLYLSPDKGEGKFVEWHNISGMYMDHKAFRGDHITIGIEGEDEEWVFGSHMGLFEQIEHLHALRTGPL